MAKTVIDECGFTNKIPRFHQKWQPITRNIRKPGIYVVQTFAQLIKIVTV